jgi:hypothetical protein
MVIILLVADGDGDLKTAPIKLAGQRAADPTERKSHIFVFWFNIGVTN